jgi:UrcA family protein
MHNFRFATRFQCGLAAAIIASALIVGGAEAADDDVTVSISVNRHGLDLSQAQAVHRLYQRVEYAAYVACTRANRVGLAPAADPSGCYEKSLAGAIRSANIPLLTNEYLANHTLREASRYGMDLPPEVAAAK